MISDNTGATLSPTVQTAATETLDGTVFSCLSGISSAFPQVGNITVNFLGKLCT